MGLLQRSRAVQLRHGSNPRGIFTRYAGWRQGDAWHKQLQTEPPLQTTAPCRLTHRIRRSPGGGRERSAGKLDLGGNVLLDGHRLCDTNRCAGLLLIYSGGESDRRRPIWPPARRGIKQRHLRMPKAFSDSNNRELRRFGRNLGHGGWAAHARACIAGLRKSQRLRAGRPNVATWASTNEDQQRPAPTKISICCRRSRRA